MQVFPNLIVLKVVDINACCFDLLARRFDAKEASEMSPS
jgi:hypothetical protein